MFGMIMSFAQYERELTAERIRDKVAASKKKGMWMGGTIPLGYNAHEGKLSVNEDEAKVVKNIFNTFLENQSLLETAREMNKHGFTTKSWVSKKGNLQVGKKFNIQTIKRALENPLYIGMIDHKKSRYQGLHKAIISDEVWNKVSAILTRPIKNQIITPVSRLTVAPILKGLIYCGICGRKMIPTYTAKEGTRYRYYICPSKVKGDNENCPIGRLAANEAENLVTSQVLQILKRPEIIVNTIAQSGGRVTEDVVINSFKQIGKVWDELFPAEQARIIGLLVKNVEVRPNGLNVRIFKEGLGSLSTELNE
jgi:predicted transcriptional regulator